MGATVVRDGRTVMGVVDSALRLSCDEREHSSNSNGGSICCSNSASNDESNSGSNVASKAASSA